MRALVLSVALLVGGARAWADSQPASGLETWWTEVNTVLDELAARHKIVPPTPVQVRWRAREIWSGALSGELVDLMAVDLGGDGKSELVALTADEVVVFSRTRGLFKRQMLASLPLKPASLRSRDPIGSLGIVVDEGLLTLRARSSEQAVAGIYQLESGVLRQVSEAAGYPLCHSSTIFAAPGRNYFLGETALWSEGGNPKELAEALYSVRCTRAAVDPSGRAVELLSAVSTAGELRLHCTGNPEFCALVEREYQGVGDAHVIADINNDGFPDLIHSSRTSPQERDSVQVLGRDESGQPVQRYQHEFGGGIVGIAAGDFSGDRLLEVVVAERVRGTRKVTLWLLN